MVSAFYIPKNITIRKKIEGSESPSHLTDDCARQIPLKTVSYESDPDETEDEEIKMNCIGGVQPYMTTDDESSDDDESHDSDLDSDEDEDQKSCSSFGQGMARFVTHKVCQSLNLRRPIPILGCRVKSDDEDECSETSGSSASRSAESEDDDISENNSCSSDSDKSDDMEIEDEDGFHDDDSFCEMRSEGGSDLVGKRAPEFDDDSQSIVCGNEADRDDSSDCEDESEADDSSLDTSRDFSVDMAAPGDLFDFHVLTQSKSEDDADFVLSLTSNDVDKGLSEGELEESGDETQESMPSGQAPLSMKRVLSVPSFEQELVGSDTPKRMRCTISSHSPIMPEITLGPPAFVVAEENRRLYEELRQPDLDEFRSSTPVPLISPPPSPLKVESNQGPTTVCEWPSNLAIDSALTAVRGMRAPSPGALQQLEAEEEDRIFAFLKKKDQSYSTGATSVTPLLKGI